MCGDKTGTENFAPDTSISALAIWQQLSAMLVQLPLRKPSGM
jgi:hypothetical protein